MNDEQYVKNRLAEKFGAMLKKRSTSKTPNVKVSDFYLLDQERPVAVIEVKTLEESARTEENGWKVEKQNSVIVKSKSDKGPQRVATVIRKAWDQLKNEPLPKALAFVNKEPGLDFGDVEEAVNGGLWYANHSVGISYNNTASASRDAVRRICKEGDEVGIDLYIWLDKHPGAKTEDPQFRFATDSGYRLASDFFGPPLPSP